MPLVAAVDRQGRTKRAATLARELGDGLGLEWGELVGSGRAARIVKARRAVARYLRGIGLTNREVGVILGGRDRSTVANLVKPRPSRARGRAATAPPAVPPDQWRDEMQRIVEEQRAAFFPGDEITVSPAAKALAEALIHYVNPGESSDPLK